MVGIRVRECHCAGAEPVQQIPLHQQEQYGKDRGKNKEHGKAVRQDILRPLLISRSQTYREKDGASDTDQCPKRG